MSQADIYANYFISQAEGRGVGGNFKQVRGQKGFGLGSILLDAFRNVMPLLKSGAKALGGELFNTGLHLLRDTINGKPVKESVRERVTNAGQNLTRRAATKIESMVGNGIKRKRRAKRSQSKPGRKRRKVVSRKKPKTKKRAIRRRRKATKKDIFG
jgi:hypothetical protein